MDDTEFALSNTDVPYLRRGEATRTTEREWEGAGEMSLSSGGLARVKSLFLSLSLSFVSFS